VKDAAGRIHQEGKIGSTRRELDAWIKTLSQPRMIAMEATIFTGWIYDHLLPHAEKERSLTSFQPRYSLVPVSQSYITDCDIVWSDAALRRQQRAIPR
jgi:hypothetical protein